MKLMINLHIYKINFTFQIDSLSAGKADKSKVGLFSFKEIYLYTSCVLISALILGLSLNSALTKVLDVLRGISQALANIPIKFENTLNKINNTC